MFLQGERHRVRSGSQPNAFPHSSLRCARAERNVRSVASGPQGATVDHTLSTAARFAALRRVYGLRFPLFLVLPDLLFALLAFVAAPTAPLTPLDAFELGDARFISDTLSVTLSAAP